MKTFKEMPLAEELQTALSKLKFTEPTEIQSAVIAKSIAGGDIMACAETGSGKTAAYGIPLVARLLEDENKRALVLAPTRELAQQITEFLRSLAKDCHKLQVVCLVGGMDIRKQLRALQSNPRMVVATPGRLTDHLKRKSIRLDKTQILVLDEGDRMLDMGFAPQLNEILRYLPKERQTSLFSATLPDKVVKLASKYLSKPTKITVGRISLPVASIKQSIVQVTFKEKDEQIINELNQRTGSVIIFSRTKNRTDRLAKHLDSYGFAVDLIHGGRTQGQRNKAIRDFKKGTSRILCATDVAARGIDVPQVEHVINFDLPMMDEDYVHRIGRTARNGALGEAVSFVMPEEHRAWEILARKYKIQGVDLVGVSRRPLRKGRGRSMDDYASSDRSYKKSGGKSQGRRKSRFGDDDAQDAFSKFGKKRNTKKSNARSYDSDKPSRPSSFKDHSSREDDSERPKRSGFKRRATGNFRNDDRDEGRSFKKKSSSSHEDRRGKPSYKKKSSNRFSEDKPSFKKKSSSRFSEEKPSFKKKENGSREESAEGGTFKKKSSFKRKGTKFSKSGGFKKSRAKKFSSKGSSARA